ITYEFPKGAQIPGRGFLVLARDAETFKKVYGVEPGGIFKSALKKTGENLELNDAQGKRVDRVHYKNDPPWPLSPNGGTATLEGVCPDGRSNDPANWAASPLSKDARKPAGTPGKQNANYATTLPPSIQQVKFEPRQPNPGQEVAVSAEVSGELDSVTVV